MKTSNLPRPGTKAFNQLAPQARTLARWKHNYTPINTDRKTEDAQTRLNQVNPQ